MAVTIGEDLEPGARCDYCSQHGAAVLAQTVREFWSGLGFEVRVWIEPVSGCGAWAVRSALQSGLPPGWLEARPA